MTNITLMDVTFDRIPLKKNYTQVSNELIQDVIKKKRLSVDSLTLMTVLYALYPEDERLTNFNAWMEMLGWGINKIKKAISDLAELGYIHIQKNRDQWGRFTHNSYQFYHSPADNPYFGKSSKEQELKTSENDVSSIAQNPCHGDEEKYIFYYNTSSCWSVSSVLGMEQTDFQQTEIVETVETADNEETLSDCIKQNIQQIATEKPELQEKVSKLEMPIFVTYLVGVLRDALKKLKHPEAKGKFIKSIILNKINEFKAKKPAPNPTMKPAENPTKTETPVKDAEEKLTPLTQTLALIGSQLVDEDDPDCEHIDYYYNLPSSIRHEDVRICVLPYSLRYDKKSLRDALDYVTGYCYDWYGNFKDAQKDTQFRNFMYSVLDTLTEVITTGRAGKRNLHYYDVIDKINQIIRIDGELSEFLVDFQWYFCRTLEAKANEGKPVCNQKRYLTVVLVDYLMNYNAYKILPTIYGSVIT